MNQRVKLMAAEPLDVAEQVNFATEPFGPSSRGCGKVSNGNVCGSGSLVGVRNGVSLFLTNAHVAGTRIGKTMTVTFPFADNLRVTGRVIMAGYSDRVMMDWAVLELDRDMREYDLPHAKLDNTMPEGEHYTGGYPRCRGPYFQRLTTQRITHNGTVWRWQPISIGGQSGSGVHSFVSHLQKGILTWSWGGDGAGQTAASIWSQYARRAAVGYPKPPDLVELNERAEDLEEGFFAEADITTLPIWHHLDPDGDDDDGGDDEPPQPSPEFAKAVMERAVSMQRAALDLAELARKYSEPGGNNGNGDHEPGDEPGTDDAPRFGL